MAPITLRDNPSTEDDSWIFQAPPPHSRRPDMGLIISFSPDKITLDRNLFPQNRILQTDDASKFILASFQKLRFPDTSPRVAEAYMIRFFKAGLFLNGKQYRFYGHSNSQLRSRSCFLREANTDEELDRRIYQLGDFLKITSAAKRSKRIGLLFSESKIDWTLHPRWVKDIEDIVHNGETFSDGCGLISTKFAKMLSKHKRIMFHRRPYTPTVYQIRYRGYKGVLMLEPGLESDSDSGHVHFRKSQKKFTAMQNDTFSVVDYSCPFAFGRLNNDIVVLLSSLGVRTEVLLAKQDEYHRWLQNASEEWEAAFDLLCAANKFESAERLLLDGLENSTVRQDVLGLQHSELASLRKNDRLRVRMLVPKSRLLFGVCDPYGILRPGEVHVRITVPRTGVVSLTNVDVAVVRNPCLYPGDILKLRATYHEKLNHLVDCVVFASRGTRAAPSMSSGGDLDGDKFAVIWDPDLVPPKAAEAYDYPAPPERVSKALDRQDLAKHFASYNSITMGRVSALHAKWVRLSPAGAMSAECQELNALYSLAVDGGSIKIPDRLTKLPEKTDLTPYVLDALHEAAKSFAEDFRLITSNATTVPDISESVANNIILTLLASRKATMSEYEVVCKAAALARKYSIDIRHYLPHIDFSALNVAEKYAISNLLDLSAEEHPYIWNSLIRSDILHRKDLEDRELNRPLRLQRLYTSAIQGRAAFFEYLKDAIQNYRRRMIIFKTDYRFSAGIFLRGDIAWDEDHIIDDNILACSFLPESSTTIVTYKRGVKGWVLSCNDNSFQLYNRQRANTFIFMTRPAEKSGQDIVTSIALQNFSRFVQQQYGRMNRTPIGSIEIHVVSNRDRVAHQLFDLRFEHVQTEEFLSRFDHRPGSYSPNSLMKINWDERPPEERTVLVGNLENAAQILSNASADDALTYFRLARLHRAEDRMFHIFERLLEKDEVPMETIQLCMEEHPPLAYCALKKFLEGSDTMSPPSRTRLAIFVLHQIVRCANELGMASLAGLERLTTYVAELNSSTYLDLLWLAALTIRAPPTVQEILLVLHDCRSAGEKPLVEQYAHNHSLAVAFDRSEEAEDACPCDEQGRPKRRREAPIATKLRPVPPPRNRQAEEPEIPDNSEQFTTPTQVMAHVRVDLKVPIRIHSHVRLRVASSPEHSTLPPAIVDAVAVRASRGEICLDILQPLPPEWSEVDWHLYPAGSIVTSKAMMDAIQRLVEDGLACCRFRDIITGQAAIAPGDGNVTDEIPDDDADFTSPLNLSQRRAALSARLGHMSLIWGPPGTGKTTVVVQILLRLLRQDPESKVLMSASTHNAVDNVLERFIVENAKANLLKDDQILRAATESSRVDKALQKYTMDARLGGSLTDDPRLVQKAQKRVKDARIVFTTCAGAALGMLRKAEFGIVLIDEASQISEPTALIPLVKGCTTAVMVGDHVQLRPTVRSMGKALEFDKSLFERLYTGPSFEKLTRTMLEIQYRFSEAINTFPSHEFYEGRLTTGNPNRGAIARLGLSKFPWYGPTPDGLVVPVAFVPCSAEEDFGRSSKSNKGQANLVKYIVGLLRALQLPEPRTPRADSDDDNRSTLASQLNSFSISVLTPYSRQSTLLKQTIPQNMNISVSTIDGFQGRESDIIVLSTVRSNVDGDLGFVDDPRRLNVAWTRPKVGLIIVGDPRTLRQCPLWGRALDHCQEVVIPPPDTPQAQDQKKALR